MSLLVVVVMWQLAIYRNRVTIYRASCYTVPAYRPGPGFDSTFPDLKSKEQTTAATNTIINIDSLIFGRVLPDNLALVCSTSSVSKEYDHVLCWWVKSIARWWKYFGWKTLMHEIRAQVSTALCRRFLKLKWNRLRSDAKCGRSKCRSKPTCMIKKQTNSALMPLSHELALT